MTDLVVMVTHNPELAEEYANRIVRLKDGEITDDTNPYVVEKLKGRKSHNIKIWVSPQCQFSLHLHLALTI